MTTPISVMASAGALVDIDATIAIQLGIFLLMFLLLRQLLFKPVIRLIEARREATVGMQASAKEFDTETEKLVSDVDAKISEVTASATSERDKMMETARQKERELLSKAREDAENVLEEAKKHTAEQAEQAKQALRQEVEILTSSVASTVLGRQI